MDYGQFRRSNQVEDRRRRDPLQEVLGALYAQNQAHDYMTTDADHPTYPRINFGDPAMATSALAKALGIDSIGGGLLLYDKPLSQMNPWGI